MTRQAADASRLLGIEVLDYIVIGRGSYLRMKDRAACEPGGVASASHERQPAPGREAMMDAGAVQMPGTKSVSTALKPQP